jgi:hypothetical protein
MGATVRPNGIADNLGRFSTMSKPSDGEEVAARALIASVFLNSDAIAHALPLSRAPWYALKSKTKGEITSW